MAELKIIRKYRLVIISLDISRKIYEDWKISVFEHLKFFIWNHNGE